MKVLVISDIHGDIFYMSALIAKMTRESKPDALIFCGDGLQDALTHKTTFSRFAAVRGNCDFSFPPEIALERTALLSGVYIFITHGHMYKVKRSLLSLNFRAREVGAQVACFGHTHQPYLERHRGVLMLNPGALCNGCYAVLDIDDARNVEATLMSL